MAKKISLTLMLNGDKISTINVPEKPEISVGRSEEMDITLDPPTIKYSYYSKAYTHISRHHFTLIRYDLEGIEKRTFPLEPFLADETLTLINFGKNGTGLNGLSLELGTEYTVHNSDVITTPLYSFKVSIND